MNKKITKLLIIPTAVLSIILLTFGIWRFISNKNQQENLVLKRQCSNDAQTFFEKTKKEYNLGGSYSLRTSFFNKELNTCLLEYSYIFVSYNPKNPSLNGMFKIDYIIDVYSGKRLVMNNYDKVDNKDEPTIIFEGKEYGNNYNEARDNLFK